MAALASYLSTEFVEHRQEIERLEAMLREALPVFARFFYPSGCWTYTIESGGQWKAENAQKYSSSTNAMITSMLGHVLSFTKDKSITAPQVHRFEGFSLGTNSEELDKTLHQHYTAAVKRILKELPVKLSKVNKEHEHRAKVGQGLVTYSSTFGLNDPFSLSWLFDIFQQIEGQAEVRASLSKSRIETLKSKASKGTIKAWNLVERNFPKSPLLTKTAADSLDHSFPWMRWAALLRERGDKVYTSLLQHLEGVVHRQLSYSIIPDSEYDPAEMIFGLEGVLRLKPDFDFSIVRRVFTALASEKEVGVYWRAHKPMLARPQGLVLPPISTEIANSLLRIIGLLNNGQALELLTSHRALLCRYADWLLSRCIRGKAQGPGKGQQEFTGWHSDHVLATNSIHLWTTSQAVLFIFDYAALLQRFVVHKLKQIANFTEKSATQCKEEANGRDCKNEIERREPLADTIVGSQYCVTDRLMKDFLQPWLEGKPKNFSMLIYGPPGTGKTTLVQLLAGALDWDLVTITPSDFVRGGEARVEEQAKAIFQALEQMSEVVILFDEIDRLLLDRDARAYNSQGDIFQFMTPGMLTKINNLREKKRLIFVIATNYAERIDGAIKRAGRIDKKYLWLPPNAAQRRKILSGLFQKRLDFPLSEECTAPLKLDHQDAFLSSFATH